jgi:RND family efflux transporter MFP subunit
MMRGRVSNNVSAEAAPEENAPEKPELKGLVVQPVSMGESWDVVAATGKVGPNINKVVKVGPRIAGRIATVSANVGDVVSRGQVLATLSSIELAQARSAYKQAASRVKAAEQSYNQQTRLAKMGGFNTRPLEEARSEQSTAQGELAQAKEEVAQYKSELVRAESELAQCTARFSRAKDLYKDQIVSKQDYEAAEAEFKRDSADVETARTKIRQAEAKVQQAQDRTKVAKGYLDREQKIFGSDILSARELQTARAAVTSAKLEMESAADTIRVLGASPDGSGDTISIVSPISGRIVERNVNIGEMAEPSGTLFTIMNLSDVWVEANVYEKDLTKIRKGQSAEIRVNTFADKAFTGTVTYIGDVLDSASRTAKIRCAVSNPNGALKPEMFATINIVTAKRGDAILIPKKSVLDDSGKKIAYIACMECPEDIKAGTNACGAYDRRELSLGSAHGDRVEVTSGLNRGDKVVTDGAYQLKTALGSGKLEAGCTDH